jgi:WD40 repeat protein
MKKMLVLMVAILIVTSLAQSQDYFKDTVWTREVFEPNGFFLVKFSQNDSLVVAHGYANTFFLDAKTGNEVKKISGRNEIYYFNGDKNFVRLSIDGLRFEIFDANTYEKIDTLESDGKIIYPITCLSNDKKIIAACTNGAITFWNLSTKKIIKRFLQPVEQNLTKFIVEHIDFTTDGTKLMASYYKEYGVSPNLKTLSYMPIYDFFSMDSISNFNGFSDFRLSSTGRYIAFKTGDPDYGVEIYDFATKQLIRKLQINGPSLSGLEFSPDDKYLVTSNTVPQNVMYIWEIGSGEKVHEYPGSSFRSIKLSKDGKYIAEVVSRWVELLYFRTNNTDVVKEKIIHSIYPNPTSGIIYIPNSCNSSNYEIYDISGQLLFSNSVIGQNELVLDFAKYPTGCYFIKVNSGNKINTYKVIKE